MWGVVAKFVSSSPVAGSSSLQGPSKAAKPEGGEEKKDTATALYGDLSAVDAELDDAEPEELCTHAED